MDLWIRSQDKRILRKIEYLEVDEFDGIITDDECNHLGTYESQERALEVLDEMFEELKGNKMLEYLNKHNGNMDNVFPILTYQMPKE